MSQVEVLNSKLQVDAGYFAQLLNNLQINPTYELPQYFRPKNFLKLINKITNKLYSKNFYQLYYNNISKNTFGETYLFNQELTFSYYHKNKLKTELGNSINNYHKTEKKLNLYLTKTCLTISKYFRNCEYIKVYPQIKELNDKLKNIKNNLRYFFVYMQKFSETHYKIDYDKAIGLLESINDSCFVVFETKDYLNAKISFKRSTNIIYDYMQKAKLKSKYDYLFRNVLDNDILNKYSFKQIVFSPKNIDYLNKDVVLNLGKIVNKVQDINLPLKLRIDCLNEIFKLKQDLEYQFKFKKRLQNGKILSKKLYKALMYDLNNIYPKLLLGIDKKRENLLKLNYDFISQKIKKDFKSAELKRILNLSEYELFKTSNCSKIYEWFNNLDIREIIYKNFRYEKNPTCQLSKLKKIFKLYDYKLDTGNIKLSEKLKGYMSIPEVKYNSKTGYNLHIHYLTALDKSFEEGFVSQYYLSKLFEYSCNSYGIKEFQGSTNVDISYSNAKSVATLKNYVLKQFGYISKDNEINNFDALTEYVNSFSGIRMLRSGGFLKRSYLENFMTYKMFEKIMNEILTNPKGVKKIVQNKRQFKANEDVGNLGVNEENLKNLDEKSANNLQNQPNLFRIIYIIRKCNLIITKKTYNFILNENKNGFTSCLKQLCFNTKILLKTKKELINFSKLNLSEEFLDLKTQLTKLNFSCPYNNSKYEYSVTCKTRLLKAYTLDKYIINYLEEGLKNEDKETLNLYKTQLNNFCLRRFGLNYNRFEKLDLDICKIEINKNLKINYQNSQFFQDEIYNNLNNYIMEVSS